MEVKVVEGVGNTNLRHLYLLISQAGEGIVAAEGGHKGRCVEEGVWNVVKQRFWHLELVVLGDLLTEEAVIVA